VSSLYTDRYELFENGVLLSNVIPPNLSASITGRGDGTYRYNVRACNSAGCSAFNADKRPNLGERKGDT